MELQADQFAGRYLNLLGYNSERAVEFYRIVGAMYPFTGDYPGWDVRMERILYPYDPLPPTPQITFFDSNNLTICEDKLGGVDPVAYNYYKDTMKREFEKRAIKYLTGNLFD